MCFKLLSIVYCVSSVEGANIVQAPLSELQRKLQQLRNQQWDTVGQRAYANPEGFKALLISVVKQEQDKESFAIANERAKELHNQEFEVSDDEVEIVEPRPADEDVVPEQGMDVDDAGSELEEDEDSAASGFEDEDAAGSDLTNR